MEIGKKREVRRKDERKRNEISHRGGVQRKRTKMETQGENFRKRQGERRKVKDQAKGHNRIIVSNRSPINTTCEGE